MYTGNALTLLISVAISGGLSSSLKHYSLFIVFTVARSSILSLGLVRLNFSMQSIYGYI